MTRSGGNAARSDSKLAGGLIERVDPLAPRDQPDHVTTTIEKVPTAPADSSRAGWPEILKLSRVGQSFDLEQVLRVVITAE